MAALDIDGSIHLERIPDSVASRFVVISLALPLAPTPLDIKNHQARLGRLDLSTSDLAQFKALLGKFSSDYSRWKASLSTQDPVAAGSDRERLFGDFLISAQEHLSSAGFQTIKSYIQFEKRKMTIPQ